MSAGSDPVPAERAEDPGSCWFGLPSVWSGRRQAHFLPPFGSASMNHSSPCHSCEPAPFDTFCHAILGPLHHPPRGEAVALDQGVSVTSELRTMTLTVRWQPGAPAPAEPELFPGCVTVGGLQQRLFHTDNRSILSRWFSLEEENERVGESMVKSGFDAARRWSLAVQSCSCLLHILPVST